MGGGAVGIGIGYAMKKLIDLVIGVIKVVVALFVGLFIGGLALLEYLGVITVNWDKLYALGPILYASITSSLSWLQTQIAPMISQASASCSNDFRERSPQRFRYWNDGWTLLRGKESVLVHVGTATVALSINADRI